MVHIWHQNMLKSTATGNCLELIEEGEIPGGLLPLGPHKIANILEEIDDELFDGINLPTRSEFYKNSLAYIFGFVVRSVAPKIGCEICVDSLFNNPEDEIDPKLAFLINRKQYVQILDKPSNSMRGLLTPCKSVYLILEKADSLFRSIIDLYQGTPNVKNLDLKISIAVTKYCIDLNLFPHIRSHVLDFDPTDPFSENHLSLLIKSLVKQFLKVRLYSHAKRFTKSKVSTRHSLNKHVLFRHQ
jgi:hypothetical protein